MTDWKALARAAQPPVPEELLDQVIPPLEALEAAIRPLLQNLPPDTPVWQGPVWKRPEDAE
jgi:hypothetical protein